MAWVTRLSILEGVKRGDNPSWEEFYRIYRPQVWLRGSDYGLSEQEQADLLSDVMKAFFDAQKTFQYRPEKGRFRDYFREIIRNQIFLILRRRGKAAGQVELTEAPEPMDENDEQSRRRHEDDEWQALLFRRALEEVQATMPPRQVQAFMLCKMQGQKPTEVSKLQGVSLATVYNDCNAVFERLRLLVRELEECEG